MILDAQICKGRFEASGELGDIFRPENITAPKPRINHFGHRLLTREPYPKMIMVNHDKGFAEMLQHPAFRAAH